MKLYKTTLVIWSAFNPSKWDTTDLVEETRAGEALITVEKVEEVENPEADEHPPGSFFEYLNENDEKTPADSGR